MLCLERVCLGLLPDLLFLRGRILKMELGSLALSGRTTGAWHVNEGVRLSDKFSEENVWPFEGVPAQRPPCWGISCALPGGSIAAFRITARMLFVLFGEQVAFSLSTVRRSNPLAFTVSSAVPSSLDVNLENILFSSQAASGPAHCLCITFQPYWLKGEGSNFNGMHTATFRSFKQSRCLYPFTQRPCLPSTCPFLTAPS
jgi:hypothetical protein